MCSTLRGAAAAVAAARVLVSAAAAERNETDGEADDKTLGLPSPLLPNEQGVHIDLRRSYNQNESWPTLLTV